ncbi:MAG: 3-dehydroquinate synthase [Cellulosilyticaceae bacterium]
MQNNEVKTVYITEDFRQLGDCVTALGKVSQFMIITDSNVSQYYLSEVKEVLSGIAPVATYSFVAGEPSKHFETVFEAYNKLLEVKFDRSGMIIALGGGVVGDLAGFVAASYMRGVPFIQIPTTIVAQNDSSIGGKVGIDYHQHKNMVGAFYLPKLIYTNINTLQTLPPREIIGGLSEVIKHGLISDQVLYDYLVGHVDKILTKDVQAIRFITERSCAVKVGVVTEDPTEKGLRRILNCGHTIGHAIETLYAFKWIHGECVGYGMAMAAWLSHQRGYLTKEVVDQILVLIKAYGLMKEPLTLDAEAIYEQMAFDKKKAHGKIPFVLLEQIGKAIIVDDVGQQEIIEAIEWVKQKCI